MDWRDSDSTITVSRKLEYGAPHSTATDLRREDAHADIVIIGAGRAGFHIAQSLAGGALQVVIFDGEHWAPYDRIKLSNLLSEEITEPEIFLDISSLSQNTNLRLIKKSVIKIEPAAKYVQSADLAKIYYDKLVLCLGSSPNRPPIPGVQLKGVYTFRDLGDCRNLISRAQRASRAVIIGGGYLGLETAFGLHRRGLRCTLVEFQTQLMPGHLDTNAAENLTSRFEKLGIAVHTGRQIRSIEGDAANEAAAVCLDRSELVPADMVVICAGVLPNAKLAIEAGLAVNRGILVDNAMRTSNPCVYAVGECAEHDGRIYGLVGPAIEQAEVALQGMLGGAPTYKGSLAASSLKIASVDLFVAGGLPAAGENCAKIVSYTDSESGAYRALALRNQRLVGAVVLGTWSQTLRLRRAMETGESISGRQLRRLKRKGEVWREAEVSALESWPCDAIVCHCRLVTKAALEQARTSGAKTSEAACLATGAAQLCGSCRPLVDLLFTASASIPRRVPGYMIGALSFLVLAGVAAMLAAPPWPVSQNVNALLQVDWLWTDSLMKQVSGFSLLLLALFATVLSLRKRRSFWLLGSYKARRLFHAALGVAMIVLLFAHTGLRLGNYMNSWLMASFLATLLSGAFAGLVASLEGWTSRPPFVNGSARRITGSLHLLMLWPLPLLLLLHILMVYYF